MTKRKSIKSALFSSVVSLLLCFSMLLGTTFAWFTDSVTSANNVIQTGTLKVGMYWAEGQDAVPTDASGWADASAGAIFSYNKWEPGYTVARHLLIANEGTLAFKYQLAIVPQGEVSELADVIDVYYADPAAQITDRTVLGERLGTLADVIRTGIHADKLSESASYTATLVFKMQETAGNEYQELEIGTSFAIQLLATQVGEEWDSFGDDYDSAADYPVVSVPVTRPTGEDVELRANEGSVGITLPAAVVDALPAGVTSLGIAHTEPVYDPVNNTVTYDSIEIVDQDGKVIDLEALGNTESITVTLPAQTAIAGGTPVSIYHDGVAVASAVVADDGTISYDVIHLCEVTVSEIDGTVTTELELAAAFAAGGDYVLGADITTVNGFVNENCEKDFSLDLGGNTLTVTGDRAKLFTWGGVADLTIYNGKLVSESTNHMLNGTGTSTGASSLVYAYTYGKLVMTDVEIEGSRRGGHRSVEMYYGDAVLTNVDMNCYYGSGVNSSSGANVVLNNCDITVNGMYSAPYNSVCFSVMYEGNLTVNSGNYKLINDNVYATGASHGGWVGIVMNSGGTITTTGGTFTNVPAEGFMPQYERAIIEGENVSPAIATINLVGGTFIPQSSKVYSGYGIGDSPSYPVFNGVLTDNGDGTWTASPNAVVTTEDELKAAIAEGGYIVLGDDIVLSAPITLNDIILDGDGHTVTMSEDCNNEWALLYFEYGIVTVKNVVFDGIKGGAAIRTLDTNIVIDGCTFKNCEHTQIQGLVRLTGGDAVVRGCSFIDNSCTMALTFNFDVKGDSYDTFIVSDCLFENNVCADTALLYYVTGLECRLVNNVFNSNEISTAGNGATVYMGFTEGNTVAGNTFEGNSVVSTGTSTRVGGAIFFGYETVFVGNAFVGNTAENAEGTALGNDVCVSLYYTDIDLSGNYWGGEAPVEDVDYFVQHKSSGNSVVVNNYISE